MTVLAMVSSMLVAAAVPRTLGVEAGAFLRFGEEPKATGAWAGRRLLWRDEKPAFELSFWCGTCQFLFRRLEGANDTVSLDGCEPRLAQGIDGLDEEIIDLFASLLPTGEYLPLLLRVQPQLVRPAEAGDYFAGEQVATWGVEGFWGLPQHPQTPYYRTYVASVNAEAHLYEFIVPMVPPSWNDPARVKRHVERLRTSPRPTAVAVSILDVCQPATEIDGRDCYAHWALTHFLLDGHHKLQAAAQIDQPLQLLSLLSIDASLATTEQVRRVPTPTRQPTSAPPNPNRLTPAVTWSSQNIDDRTGAAPD